MDTDYPVYEQPSAAQQYLPSDDGQSFAPVPDMIAISQGVPGMNPYGMLPETHWGQWWSPGDSAFTESANATALNLLGQEQHFFHSDSILDQENPAQWGSPSTIFSQILPSPSTETTSPNSSPEHSQRRRGSSATQSDQRRQKRNPATVAKPRAKPTATKSTRRVSIAKTKANPTATTASEKPKRGRKVKALTKPSPPRRSKQKDEDDEDEYEEAEADPEQEYEQHSKKVQERNRIASNKFRIKKRDDAKQLRIDEQIVEQANRKLNDCVSDLTMQVYDLKMRLLQHTECDCTLIKEYIATEAQRYIKDLGEGKHANSTPALAPQPDYQHAYHEHHPQ
ncbi:hypothetical protein FAUST_5004 [Fusarium austroamericanum]|uniref:BZIP domain-containing protein n=1 Tax=Fusarium austroamericanum TaxID=282268 RepID=A0AAN6HG43_FUSAU|nr:hypothetical protein FAUST_5004 [Fusarium austroamericanum]